ncbi:unnamed protein product [Ectocarpus sp. 6 AP-2014]
MRGCRIFQEISMRAHRDVSPRPLLPLSSKPTPTEPRRHHSQDQPDNGLMPQASTYKLGSPRKLSGEGNTWDILWALQINGAVHQVSMQRRLSQKMIVKHDGKTLLDKVFVLTKPYEGYCLVAWVNQGISFGIFCTTELRCIQTNADHYDLRVNGVKFTSLPDGCRLRQIQQDAALRRSASVPNMSGARAGDAFGDGGNGHRGSNNGGAGRDSRGSAAEAGVKTSATATVPPKAHAVSRMTT